MSLWNIKFFQNLRAVNLVETSVVKYANLFAQVSDIEPSWSSCYGICPNISTTIFHCFLAQVLLFMQLFLKILCGMANCVDPDQTALEGASEIV